LAILQVKIDPIDARIARLHRTLAKARLARIVAALVADLADGPAQTGAIVDGDTQTGSP
jgi:hypothetical protein